MSTDLERTLPSALDAEKWVLGAALLDEKAYDALLQLKADDFFLPQNRRVFEAVRALSERHEPIDTFTVSEWLGREGVLEAAGGVAYIAALIDGIPKFSNVEFYAKKVAEKAIRRRVIHTANSIVQNAFESGTETETLLDHAAQAMIELAIEGGGRDGLGKTYRDAAVDCVKGLQERNVRPVVTGISELDGSTGGFLPGELIIVTAGTGVGKTLFAQQTRRRTCADGLHTLYCSVEMTPEQLVSRELATEANVEHWKMRRPNQITDEDYKALVEAAVHECEFCRVLDGELSLQKIRLTARRLKRLGQLNFLVGDYDELIDAPGKDELAQQRNLVRGMKNIAMELQIPVFLISQLRKPLDSKEPQKPTLERIYGSGSKSKHSSFVLFVDREYMRDFKAGTEAKATIYILKSRDSKTGTVDATFSINTLRFDDAIPRGSKEE